MARAALRWGVRDLAAAASVSPMTVSRLENGQGETIAATMRAIRMAVEAAGVEFMPAADGGEAWVRLRVKPP